ncbi:MAG: copper homeostasis protein CutC [Gemmatimonadota bacterium]
MTLVEVAIESVLDLGVAEAAGADRVELCANLSCGGTTPSLGAIRAVVARARVPVFVMIRPRCGDFVYSESEVDVMLRDVGVARAEGVRGIVSGALEAVGLIDKPSTAALVNAAAPLPLTFHRAFDLLDDKRAGLDALARLGVARILTAGGRGSASEGSRSIAHLVTRAEPDLTVVAGGAVRQGNVAELVASTGVREVHLGPRRQIRSAGRWGAADVLDDDEVRGVISVLKRVNSGNAFATDP